MDRTASNAWPVLNYRSLKKSLESLHLWTQIVGKIKLSLLPWLNHSWHVTLGVSPRGLSTGTIPSPAGAFQIEFDFQAHELLIAMQTGQERKFPLRSMPVAEFYTRVFSALAELGIPCKIFASPNEMPLAVPFASDTTVRSYDPREVSLYHQALVKITGVFGLFRSRFLGKCSPVHFFWGGFDLAVTRFSGKRAPLHPGGVPNMPLRVMQEAYSHEVSSVGFWPGNDSFPFPCFYSYCYPVPETFKKAKVQPPAAWFSEDLGEFLIKYERIQQSEKPEKMLLSFLQSTYEAATSSLNWNRDELECDFSSF